VLKHNLIYENANDPDKQHCSTYISRSETQTKLAAGQFIIKPSSCNIQQNCFLTIIIIYGRQCIGFNSVNSSP